MAKIERRLVGSLDSILRDIHEGLLSGSVTASFEEESVFEQGKTRIVTRAYERYSAFGGNRVSLYITAASFDDNVVELSGITSGGSQAMFFKMNTVGENAFLDKLAGIIEKYSE